MWFPLRIYRNIKEADAEHLRFVRDVIARSRELLASNPVPTTFAGRKIQEPFPSQDEEPLIKRWLTSKELRPPK
jgi:hypothetical protein